MRRFLQLFAAVIVLATAVVALTPQAEARTLIDRSSQAISQEIAGIATPDAPLLIAAVTAQGRSIIDAVRTTAPTSEPSTLLAQRSTGCSYGCSQGCSVGCSTGCSSGCSVGCR